MQVTVKNLVSPAGNEIANQFEITLPNKVVFQSYNAVIAIYDKRTGKITLDKNAWDYSKTTGKYRNQWLGESKKQTEAKIKDGTYKLADLNQ